MSFAQSVDEAVEWACRENLLDGYIRSQKMEVRAMLLTEFDEEKFKRVSHRNGVREGREEKAVETAINMLKKKYPPTEISEITDLPVEKILELQKSIPVGA